MCYINFIHNIVYACTYFINFSCLLMYSVKLSNKLASLAVVAGIFGLLASSALTTDVSASSDYYNKDYNNYSDCTYHEHDENGNDYYNNDDCDDGNYDKKYDNYSETSYDECYYSYKDYKKSDSSDDDYSYNEQECYDSVYHRYNHSSDDDEDCYYDSEYDKYYDSSYDDKV